MLALDWLSGHFISQTTPLDPSTKRLLIVDGHESHCTIDFIELCDLHNIILLVLPPHTTHYLQPLDVACFGPLQRWYSSEVEAHGRYNGTYIEKSDFLKFYQRARFRALCQENIDAAYRATGLIPFDPQRVYDKIGKPRPLTPKDQVLDEVMEQTEQEISTIRRMEMFIKETVKEGPKRKTLIDKMQALDAQNAMLLKDNAQLVANTRSRTKRTKKQLPTEARYLSKETAVRIKAEIAEKEAQKEARKARNLDKKAALAMKQAETRRTAELRQRAVPAGTQSAEAQKQRLPPRSRAKANYLLWIQEDVFK